MSAGKGTGSPLKATLLLACTVGLTVLLASTYTGGGVDTRSWLRAAGLSRAAGQGEGVDEQGRFHGIVSKAGPIAWKTFEPGNSSCVAERLQWVGAAAAGEGEAGRMGSTVRPACERCQVEVNHKYKVIYVRHAKSGSTSVMDFFGKCRFKGETDTCLDVLAHPEGEDGAWVTQEEATALWADYFVFTFVRDPFDRAVSAYHWLIQFLEPTCADLMDWDGFCANPLDFARLCAQRRECCTQLPTFFLLHVMGQDQCTLAEAGGLAVDFVGRTDRMAEDLARVVEHINARLDPGVEPLVPPPAAAKNVLQRCEAGDSQLLAAHEVEEVTWPGNNKTVLQLKPKEQYCSADMYFKGQHAHCKASVAAFFGGDLQSFYTTYRGSVASR